MQVLENPQNKASSSQALANLLKSAGDPLRVEILRALAQGSYGVLELSHIFDIRQNTMSHHLKVLSSSGLVNTRREGNSIFYRRSTTHQNPSPEDEQNNDTLELTRAMLFDSIDLTDLSESVRDRIEDIHAQRSQASKAFFAEHGTRFKEKQDLIAAFEVYGEQVINFLQLARLPARNKVLEVGPGEGEFLPKLAASFTQVTALDNSITMLERAKSHCADKRLSNIEFISSDTSWCIQQKQNFDCVVSNMVLHHTPSPQVIFADANACLKERGVLVVCELCNHDQDWTRKACGDLWLGFEPKDLSQWALTANFIEGQSSYFALRNGFQIQIREFIKTTE